MKRPDDFEAYLLDQIRKTLAMEATATANPSLESFEREMVSSRRALEYALQKYQFIKFGKVDYEEI
jgi:uncharacterized protein YcgI (DUF1989 family)